MKQIINGKEYDTSTATNCGIYMDSKLYEHFIDVTSLHRKKNGEYFAHNYLVSAYKDVSFHKNIAIVPLTEEEARKWAKKYLSVCEYENAFGTVLGKVQE